MNTNEPMVWVSVDDRLPEQRKEVLVWPNPTDYCNTAYIDPGKGWMYAEYEANDGQVNRACTVTHWMPLPASPKAAA